MVERSLSMREVPGSIPGASRTFLIFMFSRISKKTKLASSGNRTRAARVAGEHSTTEPTMRCKSLSSNHLNCISSAKIKSSKNIRSR